MAGWPTRWPSVTQAGLSGGDGGGCLWPGSLVAGVAWLGFGWVWSPGCTREEGGQRTGIYTRPRPESLRDNV